MKVELKNIAKKYEGRKEFTLENINLDISSKEFIVILGPSGCGKTTLLRMIAGLNSITKGDLLFDGKRVNELSPADRGLTMVFQSYALYPQLTVYQNIAYGLKIRKVRKDIIDTRVRDVAKILKIENHLYDKPADLSGGQRQRVAIGRAIARKPKLFLMDEPLSNLDAKLRENMRKELIELHTMVGSTTIYVTHDQMEAMTMASRIILLNNNEVQQIGTPYEMYKKPSNLFVASFLGSPTINLFEGFFKNGHFISKSKTIKVKVNKEIKQNQEIFLGIRSENIHIDDKSTNCFKAKLSFNEFLGKEQILDFKLDKDTSIFVSSNSDKLIKKNEWYNLKIDDKNILIFDKKTRKIIE